MANDYYSVLGVSRDAAPDVIKQEYRKLARKYHPDVSSEPNAEEHFKEINAAYEVLSDTEKRAMYDRYGTVPSAGMNGADFGGFRDPFDIFTEVFGNLGGFGFGQTGRSGPRRGNDVRVNATLSFEEAAFGLEKEIGFERLEPCPTCNGNGAEPGTSPERCQECNGSGQVRRVQHTILGSFVNIANCPTCSGTGSTVRTPCHECRGGGVVRMQRKKIIRIPGGVEDGINIRLAGEGDPGERGGPPGNLYVNLHVTAHPYYTRRGNDVQMEMQVNIAQATLGSTIKVPTLEGERTITIPAGTQSGTTFRLRGLGIPHLRGNGRGDQLVVIHVATPTRLDAHQRQLFEQLAVTLGTENIIEEKQSFIGRLKETLGL